MRILLLASALLAGCSGIPELEKRDEVATMTITWIRGIEQNCGGAKAPMGCALVRGSDCTITTPEDSPASIMAHEFKHCFGYIHK